MIESVRVLHAAGVPILAGTDMLIVRELTGGIYFGERGRWSDERGRRAIDTMAYSDAEVRRRLDFPGSRAS